MSEPRVVLITGAGRGIGRATAELLAQGRARLVLADSGGDAEGLGTDPEVIEGVARELRKKSGAEILTDALDLAQPGATETLVARALEHFGRIDAVVASAGSFTDRPAVRTDDALLERALGVHVRHPFALLRAAAPKMIEQKDGAFVWLAGPSAFFGLRGHAAESAGHAAAIAAARSAALELRKHNVRVNVVVPSARTRLTEALPLYKSIDDASLAPDHVAATIAFLISPDASDVSGETIGVAGPRTYAFRIRETPGAFGDGRTIADPASAGLRLREALKA